MIFRIFTDLIGPALIAGQHRNGSQELRTFALDNEQVLYLAVYDYPPGGAVAMNLSRIIEPPMAIEFGPLFALSKPNSRVLAALDNNRLLVHFGD